MRQEHLLLALLLLPLVAALLAAATPAMAQASGAVVPPVGDDIRDVREPLPGPRPIPLLPYVLVGGTVLALAAGGVVLLRRRGRRRTARQPWVVALERLDAARDLMQPENAHAFTSAMSEAVRDYLQKRFGMPLAHQTTSELLRSLAVDEHGPLAPWRSFLRVFLDDCDLVKYARGELALSRMEMLHGSAWRLVHETRPRQDRRAA